MRCIKIQLLTMLGLDTRHCTIIQPSVGNAALGFQALFNATGGSNTGLGYNSGSAVTTGSNNTLVGTSSGLIYSTGSQNTSLGAFAYSTANSINYMSLGYSSGGNWSSANNRVEIGNTSVVNIGDRWLEYTQR